jgi:tetratricopeptide (TPR) repeat protein
MKKRILYIAFIVVLFSSCSSSKKVAQTNTNDKDYTVGAIIEAATTQREIGNNDKAIDLYNQALKKDPNNAAAYYYLASIYFEKQDVDKAIKMNKLAMDKDSKNIWYPLQLSDIYLSLQKYDEAASTYEKVIKLDPNTIEYYKNLANIYRVEGNDDKELEVLNRIEKRWGVSEEVSMYKYSIYKEKKDNKKAEDEITKLQKTFPSETKYYSIIAEMAMKEKNYEKALMNYNKVKEMEPDNEYINVALANYYIETKNDDSVYYYLQKVAAQKDLEFSTKLPIIFSVYKDKVDTDTATFVKFFNILNILSVTNENQCEVWSLLNTGYMRQGNMEKATLTAKKSINLGCNEYQLYKNLLYSSSITEKPDSVIVIAKQAIELFPSEPLPYLFAGVNSLYDKDYNSCISYLNDGLKYVGSEKDLLEDFYSNLGESYYRVGNDSLAFSYFDKTLNINPNNYLILNNYAYYLSLENKNLDLALQYAKKVVEKYPENPTFVDTYAWVLYLKGDYKQAKQAMDKIISTKASWSEEETNHYKKICEKN